MNSSSLQTKPVRQCIQLNQRLSEIMKEKGMTLSRLAEKSQVAIGTVQKLMTDPNCNPTLSSLQSICNVLDVSVSVLMGQEERVNTHIVKIPLLNWENLPTWLENRDEVSIDKSNELLLKVMKDSISQSAFALKMEGNAMLPLFPEGAILIFDPEKSPRDHNYVLVKLKKDNQFVFKLLLIDKPHVYVQSTNPLFSGNILALEKGDEIIATLIQSQIAY